MFGMMHEDVVMIRPRDYLYRCVWWFVPIKALRLKIVCLIERFINDGFIKQLYRNQQTLSTISLPLKTYLTDPQHATSISKLKKDLDNKSHELIDLYLDRHHKTSWHFSDKEVKSWKEVHSTYVPYIFIPGSIWFHDVFVFRNGLSFLPASVVKRVSTGHVIDGGAAAGDSAIMFNEYKPQGIYAVEPVPSQVTVLRKNLELNGLSDAATIVPLGLGCRSGEKALITDANGHESKIEIITIDDLVMDKKVSVIKLDIEGMELEAIYGAERTIKRDKPILLISAYHTPTDLFEIKPLLENWNLGYRFMFRETEICNNGAGVHLMLIGYVE